MLKKDNLGTRFGVETPEQLQYIAVNNITILNISQYRDNIIFW